MSNPTNEQELREQLSVMIERDAMALCCNDCGGGGYDYDNTKKCDTCKGTGLTEWKNDYLIGQIIKLIQAHTNAEIAKVLDSLEAEFDRHAKSIGLWGMEGLVLDMLARTGNLSSEQKEERNAMVIERRALAVLHGAIAAERAKLKERDDE